MIARFHWRGHAVSLGAPQAIIEGVAHLSGLAYATGAAVEGWHVEAESDRLSMPGEHGQYAYQTPNDLLVLAAVFVPALILWRADSTALHAAAIVKDGQANLLMGPGYSGKTTLALEAWIAGYPVIGDDLVLVDPASRTVEAMPKPMKIRCDQAALPPRLAGRVPDSDWVTGRLHDEQALILGRNLPGMTPLGARYEVSRLFLLERSPDSATHILPVDKYAAIAAIMQQRVAASHQGLGLLTGLLGRVADRQVFRLQVGQGNPAGAFDPMLALC